MLLISSVNNVLNVLIYVLFTCRYLYLLIFNLFITSNIFTNVYHDVVCKQFQFRHLFFCKRSVLFYILLLPFIDKNVDIDFRAHGDFIMYAQNQKIEKPNNLQVFGGK